MKINDSVIINDNLIITGFLNIINNVIKKIRKTFYNIVIETEIKSLTFYFVSTVQRKEKNVPEI